MLLVAQMTLAEWLDRQLSSSGMSQNAVANYAGVSHSAVSEWRKGNRIPDPPYVWKLAEYFNADVIEVMRMAGHLPAEEDSSRAAEIVPELRSALSGLTPGEQRRLVLAAQLAVELREERAEYDASPPAPPRPGKRPR